MVDDKDVNRVLDFWFGGDTNHNYETKWFPSAGSPLQAETDATVKSEFGELLTRAEQGDLDHWKLERKSCVALILILDQFSRHVYRIENSERIKINDVKALALSEEFISHAGWTGAVSVPQHIFALMPLRHTPTLPRLELVLDHVKQRSEVVSIHDKLLDKFHRATVNRLQHLEGHQYEEGNEILEHLESATDETDMPRNKLYLSVVDFLSRQKADDIGTVAVSLSGGVDSMVLCHILSRLKPKYNFELLGLHIDYGNRKESGAEAQFVEEWCGRHGVVFRKRRIDEVRRGVTKREDYEKIARDIRYGFYLQALDEFPSLRAIIFGHHQGDVQENVISNMMKGMSLLNLSGMGEEGVVNGVRVWRPLIEYTKEPVLAFAHRYGVPYFKDTTPQWSTRGKMRNQLMPLLAEMYGPGFLNNLSGLGQDSLQLGSIMNSSLLDPLFAATRSTPMGVTLRCAQFVDQPLFFWKEALRHVFHTQLGTPMMRDKPLLQLLRRLRTRQWVGWVTLKKDNRTFLDRTTLYIFRTEVFPPTPYAEQGEGVCVGGPPLPRGPWTVTLSHAPLSRLGTVDSGASATAAADAAADEADAEVVAAALAAEAAAAAAAAQAEAEANSAAAATTGGGGGGGGAGRQHNRHPSSSSAGGKLAQRRQQQRQQLVQRGIKKSGTTLNLRDVMSGEFSYYLPVSPSYKFLPATRIEPVRGVDAMLSGVMPLVVTVGAIDGGQQGGGGGGGGGRRVPQQQSRGARRGGGGEEEEGGTCIRVSLVFTRVVG